MRYSVEYGPGVVGDMDEIHRYIAEELENPSGADKITKKIGLRIRGLAVMPARGRICRTQGVTEFRLIRQGQHSIIYRIDNEKKNVIVVAVMYARMDLARVLKDRGIKLEREK